MQFIVIPASGFTQGAQPILSYNYGAGSIERVKKAFHLMFAIVNGFGIVLTSVVMLFPRFFAGLFTADASLLALADSSMPVFVAGGLIFGIQMSCQSTFMGLGKAGISLFVALWRKVILLIPLAIILPRFFGVEGIYWAEPAADITSALTAGILFYLTVYKKIFQKGE